MKAKYCKAKSIKTNVDEKDQCWVNSEKFPITSSPQPIGIQTAKNSDFGLLQITSDHYYKEEKYLHMKFYFTTDGNNRYGRYLKSLEDYFRLEVYRHKHEEEQHHRIDQDHIKEIKGKGWNKASMVVREPEKVKGSVSTTAITACNS